MHIAVVVGGGGGGGDVAVYSLVGDVGFVVKGFWQLCLLLRPLLWVLLLVLAAAAQPSDSTLLMVHHIPPLLFVACIYGIYNMFRRDWREGHRVFRIRAGGGPFRVPRVFQQAGEDSSPNPYPVTNPIASLSCSE